MDLNNGAILDQRLVQGAKALAARKFTSPTELSTYLWQAALSRNPTPEELKLALTQLGPAPSPEAIQDFLWGLFMLPEFQIIR
jgi:hypothetical protein